MTIDARHSFLIFIAALIVTSKAQMLWANNNDLCLSLKDGQSLSFNNGTNIFKKNFLCFIDGTRMSNLLGCSKVTSTRDGFLCKTELDIDLMFDKNGSLSDSIVLIFQTGSGPKLLDPSLALRYPNKQIIKLPPTSTPFAIEEKTFFLLPKGKSIRLSGFDKELNCNKVILSSNHMYCDDEPLYAY